MLLDGNLSLSLSVHVYGWNRVLHRVIYVFAPVFNYKQGALQASLFTYMCIFLYHTFLSVYVCERASEQRLKGCQSLSSRVSSAASEHMFMSVISWPTGIPSDWTLPGEQTWWCGVWAETRICIQPRSCSSGDLQDRVSSLSLLLHLCERKRRGRGILPSSCGASIRVAGCCSQHMNKNQLQLARFNC